MMVYLEPDAFCGEAGDKLAVELSRAHLSPKVRLLLVHPIESCPFNRIIDTCPRSLVEAGIFNDLAVELRSGRYEAVSAALFAKELGVGKAFPRRWKESEGGPASSRVMKRIGTEILKRSSNAQRSSDVAENSFSEKSVDSRKSGKTARDSRRKSGKAVTPAPAPASAVTTRNV